MPPFGPLGPIAAWELRRLARRGLALRVRLAFLYALLVALVGFTAVWFHPVSVPELLTASGPTFDPAEAARFANTLVLVAFEALLVVAVAVTPAVAAGAVAEEKDRATLPVLLTTQLTDREIVFGKAAGRVALVLTAALAGVPVLALALPFGGVRPAVAAVGCALVGGTVVLCAALGVSAACAAPDLRAATVRAYGRVAVLVGGALVPPAVLLSPFAVLLWAADPSNPNGPAGGALYAALQLALAALVLARAARALRLREPTAGPPPASAFPDPPRPAPPPLVPPAAEPRAARPPVDDADPVLWKDRHAARPAWAVPGAARAAGLIAAGLAAVTFLVGAGFVAQRVGRALNPDEAERLAQRAAPPDSAGWLLTAAAVLAAGRYLLPLAAGLSAAVAGERFRNTLDPLLCAPLDRGALLGAKVRAQVERGTGAAAVAVVAAGGAFAADGGPLLGAAAAALMLAGFGLVIGAGALLTVRCATDARAFRLLLPLAVLAAGWPAGVWNAVALPEAAELPPAFWAGVLLAAAAACALAGGACRRLAARALARGD